MIKQMKQIKIEQRNGPNTKLAAWPRATAFLNFTLLTKLVPTSRYERLRLGACRQLGHDRVAVRAAGIRVGRGCNFGETWTEFASKLNAGMKVRLWTR